MILVMETVAEFLFGKGEEKMAIDRGCQWYYKLGRRMRAEE